MNEFQTVPGFEEVWREPVRPGRRTPGVLLKVAGSESAQDTRARLLRIVGRTPEVFVKLAGWTHTATNLRERIDYISRKGELEMEDRDSCRIAGRPAVRELADDWNAIAMMDSRHRANSRFSLSIVLGMPAGTDAAVVRDASRAFAREIFVDSFDYVFVLHTDTPHPHVHLIVRALGDQGQRLHPGPADLEPWRQVFARALRERGVPAEATPRRARGVTLEGEHIALRKIRERHESGRGPAARVQRDAYREAARAAFAGDSEPRAWEVQIARGQARIRGLYVAQAKLLAASGESDDQALARAIIEWVKDMPPPDSRRLMLARQLRAANARLQENDFTAPRQPPNTDRRR
jgi:Relaxase/Mobilisation nuclease domain